MSFQLRDRAGRLLTHGTFDACETNRKSWLATYTMKRHRVLARFYGAIADAACCRVAANPAGAVRAVESAKELRRDLAGIRAHIAHLRQTRPVPVASPVRRAA